MEHTEPKSASESMPPKGMEHEEKGHKGMEHKGMEHKSTMCPMGIKGTTMSLDETKEGLVMSFSNEAEVAQVQSRVAMMVKHHLTMKDHENHGLPAFTLSVKNTLTGARLMMVPKYATNLSKMKEMMAKRHTAQGDSPCPMAMMRAQPTKKSEEPPVKSKKPVKGAHDNNHKH